MAFTSERMPEEVARVWDSLDSLNRERALISAGASPRNAQNASNWSIGTVCSVFTLEVASKLLEDLERRAEQTEQS